MNTCLFFFFLVSIKLEYQVCEVIRMTLKYDTCYVKYKFGNFSQKNMLILEFCLEYDFKLRIFLERIKSKVRDCSAFFVFILNYKSGIFVDSDAQFNTHGISLYCKHIFPRKY